MLRKAFTLVEIIFVIVIIGILSVVVAPRLQSTDLQEASDQLLKHMRLTQSLALAQDFYLSEATQSSEYTDLNQKQKSSVYWFKRWWQIQFHNENSSSSSYSIYSDYPTSSTSATYGSNPNYSTTVTSSDLIAVDAHTGLYIMYDPTTASEKVPSGMRLEDVDLAARYNVQINMSSCKSVLDTSTSNHILFDHMGRPHCGKSTLTTNANFSSLNPYDKLINETVTITLTHTSSGEESKICVEPESGYIHLCS